MYHITRIEPLKIAAKICNFIRKTKQSDKKSTNPANLFRILSSCQVILIFK